MDGQVSNSAPSLVARAKGIILSPASEWSKIATEDTSSAQVSGRYVVPLALIGPVAGVIGSQVFGGAAMGLRYYSSLTGALTVGFVSFVLTIVTYALLTLIADLLAPRFGGDLSPERASKLIGYGSTPVWLAGVFALVPMLSILGVLGLYSIYLIYLGATPMLNVPREKAGVFTAVLVLCGLALNFVVASITVSATVFFASMGLFG